MSEIDHNQQLDTEDWEIAFKPYAGYPDAAPGLARHFMAIREYLKSTPPDVPQALAAIDDAAEMLYLHTHFQKGSYDLYRIIIEGRGDKAHEAQAESLGVTL